MLGFLALTMFAVSSTSRSTTVKPAANYADRAAIRRQAALSRLSALAAATENAPAGDSLVSEALCLPDSLDAIDADSESASAIDGSEALQNLNGAATTRLTPTHIESIRDGESSLATWDSRAYCDELCEDIVLGATVATTPAILDESQEKNRELSAAEISAVFQSILREKSTGSRNAKSKSQRRVSLEGLRSLADGPVRLL
ncbi:MAG TPA: hypothetical protein VGI40_26850 [Pirellulaceae bacterium]|jgi:hypothetical protein